MTHSELMAKLLTIEGNLHLLKASIISNDMSSAAHHFEFIELVMNEIRDDSIGRQYNSSKFYLAK